MITYVPGEMPVPALQAWLSHAIAPRPVAFVSTIDKGGNVNLSPFSFFNVFSTRPPVVVFSPARSGRTNTTKNTHDNVLEVPECTINVVTHSMVHQMSLSSSEYPKGVNEFVKAGFTMLPSESVRPPRVKESPFQMECKVLEVKELGDGPGAGNLIIAEIIRFHVSEDVLNEKGLIDQRKLDLVGRAGANWYVRASGHGLIEVLKPAGLGMGVDALPDDIRNSQILTGNNLGQLGNAAAYPAKEDLEQYKTSHPQKFKSREELHHKAKELLEQGRVDEAWKVLMVGREGLGE